MTADGLTIIPSSFAPEETMNRSETAVKAKGMAVFAHIDHAAGVASAGLSLRPTSLPIFGYVGAGNVYRSVPAGLITLP